MTEPAPRRPGWSSRLVRSPLTVLSTALASFLAVLVMLTARTYEGTGAGLTQTASVLWRGGHTVLRTTASGRVIATNVSAPAAAGSHAAPLSTHSSGAPGAGVGDD